MAKDDEKEAKDGEAKGGTKKLIIMVVPVVLLIAGAGWFFLLKPKAAAGPVTLPEPTPGAVVPLDPITINLAGAHFLKLGMALQPTATATELDGSKALDLAISQFSGQTIDDLSTAKGRDENKKELIAKIKLAYLPEGTDLATATGATPVATGAATSEDGSASTAKEESPLTGPQAIKLAAKLTVQTQVYDVYLTEFVMQ